VKDALRKSVLIPLTCCLAFGGAYLSASRVFGQTAPPGPTAMPEVLASVTPDSSSAPILKPTTAPEVLVSVTPDSGSAPILKPTTLPPLPTTAIETPAPRGSPPSFDDLGELAVAGSVFEKYGVRLQIPEGLGDFRVFYPVIVDWGFAPDADHPNIVMTVYNPQTRSSLFLRFEDGPDGPRPVELSRKVKQPEANAALDSVASSAEAAR